MAARYETEDQSASARSAARNGHTADPDPHTHAGPDRKTTAYDPAAYGEAVAGDYDALYGSIPDTEEAVALLAELAGVGRCSSSGSAPGGWPSRWPRGASRYTEWRRRRR